MVLPENRTPLLHDPSGSGIIGRQGSESIDDQDGRAEVLLKSVILLTQDLLLPALLTKMSVGDLRSKWLRCQGGSPAD